MHRQQPKLIYDKGKLLKGIIIRHLVLPHCRKDSLSILSEINALLPKDSYLISLMSQYTPCFKAKDHKEISRYVSTFEYRSVMELAEAYDMDGFFQSRDSAAKDYIPDFE